MAVKTIMPHSFPFISTRTLRIKHLELGKHRESELRRQLPSPLYYCFSGRKLLWNVELIKDFVLNGGDRPKLTFEASMVFSLAGIIDYDLVELERLAIASEDALKKSLAPFELEKTEISTKLLTIEIKRI